MKSAAGRVGVANIIGSAMSTPRFVAFGCSLAGIMRKLSRSPSCNDTGRRFLRFSRLPVARFSVLKRTYSEDEVAG